MRSCFETAVINDIERGVKVTEVKRMETSMEGHELKLIMTVRSGGSIPAFNGHLVRGAFFSMLKDAVPELADYLHQANKVRPYSISSLFKLDKRPRRVKKDLRLRVGDRVAMVLRVITESIARQAIKSLLEVTNAGLAIGPEVQVIISHVNYRMVPLPSLHEVNDGHHVSSDRSHVFSLRFLSPTQFVSRETNHPVVLPDLPLLLRNVHTHWEQLAVGNGARAGKMSGASVSAEETSRKIGEFLERVRRGVVVIAHDIRTVRIDIGKPVSFVGFKGWVQWKTLSNVLEPMDLTWLRNLLTIGEFLSVGKHRTAGFGWYRIENAPWIEKNGKEG